MPSEIIKDYQGIMALQHKIFGHGGCRIWGNKLQARLILPPSYDDNGIGHRFMILKVPQQPCDRRLLLADGAINAYDIPVALMNDRVQRKGPFSLFGDRQE